ncbi:acylneuraminate cytidylyltransferase family protein [Dyadobacter fanqingshengii]|uniref:Acylneuraminate cytidylyltransferase family protein n=1 Tax=Dyadobacter fanqingshengii TaxID=2906443 RepID=A0A9X1PCT8_9BACT|nr:acylneuraminate cytidylyltransferase family protein [Dyadobacter fanqingshengii]MCF0042160.1 acylneuraminate cytidylyltransferase family protein [Dyadobacter fanqingshengii]MCF2506352.1 acylneuraminate cytidylyltransferase family protein [Dyadobacter fanqingshengii]USJ35308.1 acylneuraminate cytidylyltransferase family protein [Dyadobacter fanqingshengii]
METNKTILAIIPARKDSKEVPGKNMKLLGGKPLIQYTIESALQSKLLSTIVVSSDCEETVAFAKTWERIEAPFIRPAAISCDDTPSIDVMQHVVKFYKERKAEFEYVCLLQPTSPFRSPDLIDNAIRHMLKMDADSLTTIQKTPDKYNPLWAFHLSNGQLSRFMSDVALPSRRQDLPNSYYRDGNIYLLKTSLLNRNRLLGGRCIGYQPENEVDLNINTQQEWKLAELHLEVYSKEQKNQS